VRWTESGVPVSSEPTYVFTATEDRVLNAEFEPVQIALPGDVNHDGVVDIQDLALVAMYYRLSVAANDPECIYDLNGDGVIDIYDLVIVARNWT
jgi:hypothetical protein